MTLTDLEGFFPGMLAYVGAQDAGGSESFTAVDTLVRSFTAMYPNVLIQRRRLAETFATDGALVRTVSLVYVQNVNTQSIALLKRSAY